MNSDVELSPLRLEMQWNSTKKSLRDDHRCHRGAQWRGRGGAAVLGFLCSVEATPICI